jgi:hypothetical protein
MKVLGVILELPAKQHCQFSPFTSKLLCCLASSSKTAPRISMFSIAMDADYSFYVKSIATFALTLFGYIISVIASVKSMPRYIKCQIFIKY